jgi:hypothetical protein
MTALSDDALQTLQREVQRLLGRCLLRLQQYERLHKTIVAHREISGPAHALDKVRAARVRDTAGKTLGALVEDLNRSFLVTFENDEVVEDVDNSSEVVPSVSFRMTLGLSNADLAQTKKERKELVKLRNNLVHHFIDQHDLGSLDGCREAQDALIAADGRIDHHLGQVSGWVGDLRESFRVMTEALHSDEFLDAVLSDDAPDGPVELAVPNPQKQN